MPGELDQGAVAQLVGDEGGAVGGDAEIAPAGLPLPLGEVVGQLRHHVAGLAAKIGLELEHGSPEEQVGAAADLRQADLVREGFIARSEAVAEKLGDLGADSLVPRPGREGAASSGRSFWRQSEYIIAPLVALGSCRASRDILYQLINYR